VDDVEPRPNHALLLALSHVAQGLDVAGVEHIPELLDHPEHGEITLAADVDASVEAPAFGAAPVDVRGILRGGDEVVLEKGGVVVGRLAHVLLEEGLLVGAARTHPVEILRLVHRLALVVRREHLLELPQKALLERILQRHAVETDALGVATLSHFADQLVEKVVTATMGGDHLQAAAPGDAGVGDGPELARVRMQGELVENTPAALAGLRIGVARHAVDAPAVGELQHVGGDARFGVDDDLAQIVGRELHRLCERLAVLEEQSRLELVAATHPLVVTHAGGRGALDRGVGRAPRNADLARLFHELEAAFIRHPAPLILEEQPVRVSRLDLGIAHQPIPRMRCRMIWIVSSDSPSLLATFAAVSAACLATSLRIRSSRSAATLSALARSLIARASSMISLGATASVSPMLPMVCHATVRSISLSSRPTSPSGSSSSRPTHTLATSCASRYRRICSRAERT